MSVRSTAVTVIGVVLVLIATVAPAVGGDGSAEDQTVGVTVRTVGLLAIDVDREVVLGITPPGTTTAEVEFPIAIVNDTSDGWEVFVTATDFESFRWECDEQGENCVRTPTDPLNTIPASNLHIRGGMANEAETASEMTANEGHFESAGSPFLLLTGSRGAGGTLGVDDPTTSMWLDVPDSIPDGEYSATLTYTIMASSQ
jgi:hypothetical protein